MADENFTSNLDLTASDHASNIVVSASRRMRDAVKEYERAIKDLRKSEADATADAVKEIELKKRAGDAWAKLQRAQSAQLAEDTAKHQERKRRELEKTQEKERKAAADAAAGWGVAGSAMLRYAAGFASVSAGIEAARKSFMAFGEHQRQLTTMRTNMRLSKDDTDALAAAMQKLSGQTGISIEQLNQSYARYRSQSKETFAESIKSHAQLAQAAANSGTAIEDWERIRSAANRAMKDDLTAVPGIIDGWKHTIPQQMVAPFAEGLEQVSSSLKKAGVQMGPEFALQLGAAFKNMEGEFETPTAGAKALVSALETAMDTGTNFGKVMAADTERLKTKQIDLVEYITRAQSEAKRQLAFEEGHTGTQARAQMNLTIEAVKALKVNVGGLREETDKSRANIGGIARETEKLGKDSVGAVNRLSASYEHLKVTAGGALDAMGMTGGMQTLATGLDYYTKLQKVLSSFGVGPQMPGQLPLNIGKAWWNQYQGNENAPIRLGPDAPKGMPWQGKPGGRIPGFATGGEFMVGGSGGTDTQPVGFMATPGEQVSIDPQGGMKESLHQQQNKADQALREHFARFHASDRARNAALRGDLGGMYDSKGRYTGTGGAGGQASGSGAGSGPLSGGGTGGGGGGGGDGGPPVPGVNAPLNTPVGTDPASSTGPAESLEEAYKRGYLVRPGASGGQAEFLAQHRAKIIEELKDPKKLERFMGLVQAEVGNDPKDQQAYIETTIDRWAARNQTVAQGTASAYFGSNPRYTPPSAETKNQVPGLLAGAGQGSALFPGATGNASAGVLADHIRAGRLAGRTSPKGEGFIFEQKDAAFRKQVEEAAKQSGKGVPGAPGTTTVSDLKKSLEGAGVGTPAGDIRLGEKGAHGYIGKGGVRTEAWLIDTVREASKALPEGYRAEVISSVDPRDRTPWHPGGRAIDIQIYDKDNKPVKNVGKKEGTPEYAVYERMALAARQYAALKYPDKKFIWGGHFNSGVPYDLMHFQSTGVSARGFTKQQLATPVLIPKVDATKTAGPAAVSDIEKRAAERYKAAVDRAATTVAPAAPAGPTFTQRARAGRMAPKPRPVAPAGLEDRASGKGISPREPVVRPVHPEGEEDEAAGKRLGPGPPEGRQYGGNVYEGEDYVVGEKGPEILSGRSGYVNSTLKSKEELHQEALRDAAREAANRRDRWPHMPSSTNVDDRTKQKGSDLLSAKGEMDEFVRRQEETIKGAERYWGRKGMQGGLTEQLGGGSLDRLESKPGAFRDYNPMDPKQNQDPSWPKYPMMIEPIIKPRVQNMGPASMRWTRHAERNRDQDNTRRAAREAHTDLGFQ